VQAYFFIRYLHRAIRQAVDIAAWHQLRGYFRAFQNVFRFHLNSIGFTAILAILRDWEVL